MVNWPSSGLDSLPKPTDTTKRNDPGFELHTVISDHATLIENIEETLGTTVTGTPGRGKALLGAGTDGSRWDLMPGRNYLINGDMRVNQRGTMPTADNAYTVDRWRMLLGAASVCTPSQEVSDVPGGGSRRALKLAVTATNNNKFGAFSPLEGVDIWPLRSQVVSLSMSLKVSNARIGDVRAAVLQWTGTEDAISATPITTWGNEGAGITTYSGSWAQANTPANLGVTTSWARYYIPAITISASATNLGVFIWSDDKTTTAADYLLITDVQLEEGTDSTDFERVHMQQSLARCQRYYQKTFAYVTAVAQAATVSNTLRYSVTVNGATSNSVLWQFPVTMRGVPTMTAYNPSASNTNWRNLGDGADSGASSFSGTNDARTQILNAQAAGDGPGDFVGIHATADAEL